jgi:hypothetical protein
MGFKLSIIAFIVCIPTALKPPNPKSRRMSASLAGSIFCPEWLNWLEEK